MKAYSVSSRKQLTLAQCVLNHDSSVHTVIRPCAEGQVLHTWQGWGFFLSASVYGLFTVSDFREGPLNTQIMGNVLPMTVLT